MKKSIFKSLRIILVLACLFGTISPATLAYAQQADIIIAIDNGSTMSIEVKEIENNINDLVSILIGSGVDTRVIIISADSNNPAGICVPTLLGSGNCPSDENLPSYRHVVNVVGSSNALQKILDTYNDWKGQLRPSASKTFLVASDDDSALNANEFTNALASLNPAIDDFTFHSIVASGGGSTVCNFCFINGCSNCADPCCDKSDSFCSSFSAEAGSVYIELSNQTSGLFTDLCTQDFTLALADIGTEILQRTGVGGICVPVKTSNRDLAIICL